MAAYGTDEIPAATDLVILDVERFDFGPKVGDRGTRVSAETVYVSDNGFVEAGDIRVPAADAVAWLRAVADHIDARQDAS